MFKILFKLIYIRNFLLESLVLISSSTSICASNIFLKKMIQENDYKGVEDFYNRNPGFLIKTEHLVCACYKKSNHVFYFLARENPEIIYRYITEGDNKGKNILYISAELGADNIFRFLLTTNENINPLEKLDIGLSPLEIALVKDRKYIIKSYLQLRKSFSWLFFKELYLIFHPQNIIFVSKNIKEKHKIIRKHKNKSKEKFILFNIFNNIFFKKNNLYNQSFKILADRTLTTNNKKKIFLLFHLNIPSNIYDLILDFLSTSVDDLMYDFNCF